MAKQTALELGQERGRAVVMPRGQIKGVARAAGAVDRAREDIVLLEVEDAEEEEGCAEAIFLAPQTALLVLAVPTKDFM